MNLESTDLKNFERLALNTPGLKNYGRKALDVRHQIKDGFVRLRDNRIVKYSDVVKDESNPESNALDHELIEAQAAQFPEVRNMKALAYNNGILKNGYYVLESGKVISLKSLNKAVTEAAKLVEAAAETVNPDEKE
jgi:hypothetical protein